jgi:hypothetical protein
MQILGKFAANSPRILLKLERWRISEIRTIDAVMIEPMDGRATCERPFRQRSVHHATHRSPCNPLFTIPAECRASNAGKACFGAPKSGCCICLSVRLSGV